MYLQEKWSPNEIKTLLIRGNNNLQTAIGNSFRCLKRTVNSLQQHEFKTLRPFQEMQFQQLLQGGIRRKLDIFVTKELEASRFAEPKHTAENEN